MPDQVHVLDRMRGYRPAGAGHRDTPGDALSRPKPGRRRDEEDPQDDQDEPAAVDDVAGHQVPELAEPQNGCGSAAIAMFSSPSRTTSRGDEPSLGAARAGSVHLSSGIR